MKAKTYIRSLLVVAALALFGPNALASTVVIDQGWPRPDPADGIYCRNAPTDPAANCWTASTAKKGFVDSRNFEVSNVGTPTILDAFYNGVPDFADLFPDSSKLTGSHLYKAESPPPEDDPSDPDGESGPLDGAYSTVFEFIAGGEDYRGAKISYDSTAGPAVDCSISCFLLVKDGNHSPAAFLFDLAIGSVWDGKMDLVLKNFWLGNGSISHIALYGKMTASPVPVPAAFWMFGTALLGFIGLARSTRV